jgi:hypothetical protein
MTVPFKFGWLSLSSRIPVAGYLFEEARRKELRNLCTNMPLNSAIWVQNLGITTYFPRFECSVTPMLLFAAPLR